MVHIRAGDEEIYASPFCVNIRPYNAELRPSAVGSENKDFVYKCIVGTCRRRWYRTRSSAEDRREVMLYC